MYEMEGPRGLTARTGRLLGRPALRGQPPGPETRLKRRLPGSSSVPEFPPVGPRFRWPTAGAEDPPKVPVTRLFQRSGVAPGMVPVSNGECIFTASREVPQGLSAGYLKIL
jgi:hypothetical protein